MQARVKGTGLGLPLSKRLAELLGGTLTVQSELGIGSRFEVRLPVHVGKSKPEPPKEPRISQTQGPVIFFIEDNKETTFVHEASLRRSDYSLHFALNIPEARAVMKKIIPDVVALDRFIDGEDSLFFIQELKDGGYKGPVLVISVIDDPQSAIAAGANAFLAKPVTSFKLSTTLRELLSGQTFNTLLLADDDEVSRYLLAEALTKLGYNILEAQDGREAIRMIEDYKLDGVFLDLVMPDLTGFEVLREIMRNPLKRTIPIIVHSSKDLSQEETAELASLGALSFTKREFSEDLDSEKLRQLLAASGIGQ